MSKFLATFNGIAWAFLIVTVTRFLTGGEVSFGTGVFAGIFLAILTLVTRLVCLVVARGLSIAAEIEKHARETWDAATKLLEEAKSCRPALLQNPVEEGEQETSKEEDSVTAEL